MSAKQSCHGLASGAARPIVFGLQQAFSALSLSLTVYAFMAAWAVLLSQAGLSEATCLAVVHAGSAASLLVFWRLGRWGNARFDSFGAALVLLASVYRLHALIDTLFFGTRVEQIYAYGTVPMPDDAFLLFFKAETIALFGLLLVACSWRLRVGPRVESYSFMQNAATVPVLTAVMAYVAALGVDVLTRVLGVSFGVLTMFSGTLFLVGVASIYFVAARRPSRGGRVSAAIIMALPMTLLALNKGMKSEMFLPLVPAAIHIWMGYRHVVARSTFVLLAVSVLALSQLYVFHVRQVAWHSGGIERVSPIVLLRGYVEALPTINPVDAVDSISSRINLTTTHAITVTLADKNGFEPANVFGPIPATFVPRFLWPDKPILMPGAQHTARIRGLSVPLTDIQSATAAGFVTELYLGGGWIGVALGALAFGFLLASAQNWAFRRAPGFGHLVFCFLAAYWAFRFDENHVVYSYTGVVFLVAFLLVLRKLTGALGLKSTGAARARSVRGGG
ncbi:MAG: hypothetical protein K0M70_03110 [Arenimonas sp.]|uniref:hypothetical protein n=1 Tax=Arenimonas sp. TaxID=1872635 RepID=UPI0025C5E1F2|nr:hypothetical protein [Arenimonas sp.]MBW8366832.1 hypothetical protein [Arenimonas sp.]